MAAPSPLADLVTQAVDEATAQAPPEGAPTRPQEVHLRQQQQQQQHAHCTRGGWLCRCFGGKAKGQQNLAAIVPSESVPPPATSQELPRGPQTQGRAEDSRHASQERQEKSSTPLSTPSASSSRCSSGPSQNAKTAAQRRGMPPQLGPQTGKNIGRKTLVLDLDETLVHSSFRRVANADITITVEIEGEHHQVYVCKRPGCDDFLVRTAQLYEIVVYTASMSKYAEPLLDKLDVLRSCSWRLFREACTKYPEGYVKDLSLLGRDLKQVIIIDNSPICYMLQRHNAIPIKTWRDDVHDRELFELVPILESLADVGDIPVVLQHIIWSGEDCEQEAAESKK